MLDVILVIGVPVLLMGGGYWLVGWHSKREEAELEKQWQKREADREKLEEQLKARREAEIARKRISMEVLPWTKSFVCSKCTQDTSWDWKKAPPELCHCKIHDDEHFHSWCPCGHEVIVLTADKSPKPDAQIIVLKGGKADGR